MNFELHVFNGIYMNELVVFNTQINLSFSWIQKWVSLHQHVHRHKRNKNNFGWSVHPSQISHILLTWRRQWNYRNQMKRNRMVWREKIWCNYKTMYSSQWLRWDELDHVRSLTVFSEMMFEIVQQNMRAHERMRLRRALTVHPTSFNGHFYDRSLSLC